MSRRKRNFVAGLVHVIFAVSSALAFALFFVNKGDNIPWLVDFLVPDRRAVTAAIAHLVREPLHPGDVGFSAFERIIRSAHREQQVRLFTVPGKASEEKSATLFPKVPVVLFPRAVTEMTPSEVDKLQAVRIENGMAIMFAGTTGAGARNPVNLVFENELFVSVDLTYVRSVIEGTVRGLLFRYASVLFLIFFTLSIVSHIIGVRMKKAIEVGPHESQSDKSGATRGSQN